MKKTILITRPNAQAQDIKDHLEAHDFEIVVEPIFSVQEMPLTDSLADMAHIAAIILTSSNAANTALEAMRKLNLAKDIKIFAVGKKTARALNEAGYHNIIYAQEMSAHSLKKTILQHVPDLDRQNDVLLYFCGEFISLDFQEEFAKYDIILEKIISYKIIEHESFSPAFLTKIEQFHFDFILLYSRNSAKHFVTLLKKHDVLEKFQNSTILCLSDKILSFIRNVGFTNSATFDEIAILKKIYE